MAFFLDVLQRAGDALADRAKQKAARHSDLVSRLAAEEDVEVNEIIEVADELGLSVNDLVDDVGLSESVRQLRAEVAKLPALQAECQAARAALGESVHRRNAERLELVERHRNEQRAVTGRLNKAIAAVERAMLAQQQLQEMSEQKTRAGTTLGELANDCRFSMFAAN